MELAEVVMNPTRQRIFQYFLLYDTGTVKEIRKALPDIPSASLYRHVKILADSSILMVLGENRIRGTVESIYQLNKNAMATEDETGNAVQMSLLSICASFAKYFSTGNADPQKDMLLFTNCTLLLTDEEFSEYLSEINQVTLVRLVLSVPVSMASSAENSVPLSVKRMCTYFRNTSVPKMDSRRSTPCFIDSDVLEL